MQRIIVFVGSDRTGKSHIAHEVADRLGLRVYKASTERDTFLSSQSDFLTQIRHGAPAQLDMVEQLGTSLVFDRSYPCEWVYSRYFERETDDNVVLELDRRYAKLGAVIVWCDRDSFSGIVDDLDENLDERALSEISSLYREFLMKHTKCRWIRLGVDDEDLDREVNEVLEFIDEAI